MALANVGAQIIQWPRVPLLTRGTLQIGIQFMRQRSHPTLEPSKPFGTLGHFHYSKRGKGGFHLHLLVFPFVYQFNFRIGVLVNSSFAND